LGRDFTPLEWQRGQSSHLPYFEPTMRNCEATFLKVDIVRNLPGNRDQTNQFLEHRFAGDLVSATGPVKSNIDLTWVWALR